MYSCAVVGGNNETQCCASNDVTDDCLDVCSGNITNFPDNVLVCHTYFNIYASCYFKPPTVTLTAGYCLILYIGVARGAVGAPAPPGW